MKKTTLSNGLTSLGLDIPNEAQQKLLAFLLLLQKWNKTYNLTTRCEPEQAIAYHLLDSLSILPHTRNAPLLDVGSGGGLPGIPLAIAQPLLHVSLVDAVQKKTAFLQQVIIELGLPNAAAHHARIEKMAGQYAQISSRAFASLESFVQLTRHLLLPGGRWLAMKGVYPEDELQALPVDIIVEAVIPLDIPGLDAERHLIVMKAGE